MSTPTLAFSLYDFLFPSGENIETNRKYTKCECIQSRQSLLFGSDWSLVGWNERQEKEAKGVLSGLGKETSQTKVTLPMWHVSHHHLV